MSDFRRAILWGILVLSLVMLWDKWQIHNGSTNTLLLHPQPVASTGAAKPIDNSVPSAVGANAAPPVTQATPSAPHEILEVRTDVLKLRLDSEGGSVVYAELLNHRDLSDAARNVVVFDQSQGHQYVAQTGLLGVNGAAAPTHKTPMTAVPGPRSLADGQNSLSVRFESPVVGGLQLVKTYTLQRGSYAVAVSHEVINAGAAPAAPKLYAQLVRDDSTPPGSSKFYSTFTGPVVYTEAKKYQKINFADVDKGKAEIDARADNGYVAMVQHYFFSAWLLDKGIMRELFVRRLQPDALYAVGHIVSLPSLAPGAHQTLASTLYVGPQEEKKLEALAPGLELVKDYGWLTILAKPLYWLLDQIHAVLGNWGWAIVALVVLLKLAFFWLNAKAYASMAKMKAINPRLQELRERLKDNPAQMQQEMMRIYREEKVNPLGGCLPIMIQIPVFIALYWVLLSSVEMRHTPWIGWIADLSAPDPYYILPTLMGLTTLLQTALNPLPPDPMQAKMMWLMPMVFSVMFFFFPAGLVLYWVTNNVLTIAQQWVINTRLGVPPKFNLPKFS